MVAQRLRHAVRAGDLVCRIGGDEFVVVAAGLQQPPLCAQPGQLGMTIGYAVAPLDATDADKLLKQADATMYRGNRPVNNRQGGQSSPLAPLQSGPASQMEDRAHDASAPFADLPPRTGAGLVADTGLPACGVRAGDAQPAGRQPVLRPAGRD
ncbi:diguanylate cyclase domain-containing protein [Aquabacterium sp.]|uniref:diguanylate cyclase domain-containing protein n=1 Tax=Aquabacterium sp. TaxID=1872578 RepID=UPI003BAFD366